MKNKNNFLSIIIFLLFFSFCQNIYSSSWISIMGSNEKTGYTEQTLSPPLNEIWSFDVPGDIISSPVIYKDKVYITSRNGYIYALNKEKGDLIWDYSTDGFIDATPSISSNVILVPSMDSNLYCFDNSNGEILWKTNLNAPSISSPLIMDNKVYVGVGEPENSIKAFSLSNGNMIFKTYIGQPVQSAISSDGNLIFFGANDGKMYGLNKENGEIVFFNQFTGGAFDMNPISCSSNTIFTLPGHDERKIYKYSSTGTFISKSQDLTTNLNNYEWNWQRVGALLLSSSTVYALAGSQDYYLMGLNKNDLNQVLVSSISLGPLGDFGFLPGMVMANNIIFTPTIDFRFLVFTSTGGLLQTINLSTSSYSSPAISDGKIYINEFSGKVKAFKSSKFLSFSNIEENQILKDTYTISINVLNSDATGYILSYSLDKENFIIISSSIYNGSEKYNYDIFDLNTKDFPNGIYYLKVNLTGNNIIDFKTIVKVIINQKPAPPILENVVDNPNDNGNKIILNWQPSLSPNINYYEIYRSSGFNFVLISTTNLISYLDNTAITNTTFTYKIKAFDGYLESDFSNSLSGFSVNDNPLNDLISPSKVNDLIAFTGNNPGEVILSWTSPGDDGNIGKANYYEIRYSSLTFNWDNASIWKSSLLVTGSFGTQENEILTGLFGGVTYYFAIRTYDLALNESELSNIATTYAMLDFIKPEPITYLEVFDTPGDKGNRLTLKWGLSPDDGSGQNDVYGYDIFRSTLSGIYDFSKPYAIVQKGVNGYIDTNAIVNIKYFYKVGVFDSTNLSISTIEASGISADNWRYVDAKNGGTLTTSNGALIIIEADSLNQNDNMILVELNPQTLTPLNKIKSNTLSVPTGIVYEVKFEKSDTKLLKEAIIKLPYTDLQISGMKEENLRMYQLVKNSWILVNTSKVLETENKVEAKINLLGIYSIMEYVPSGDLISSDKIYTYPNPATGKNLTFKFFVSDKSFVKINIYNIAGEKVASLEKENCPAGQTSEILWDIKNIASGVYLYTLKASSATGEKTITKKLAIAH